MLVPPNNFGLVEEGLYRCTKLELDNFPFLETLGLRSIVIMDAEKPARHLHVFVETQQVELHVLGGFLFAALEESGEVSGGLVLSPRPQIENDSAKADQWMLIDKHNLIRALDLVFNKGKYPILIVDSTCTFFGVLRKIQKWNFNSILNEYRIFTGSSKSNYYAETFLELVQVELVAYEVERAIAEHAAVIPDQPPMMWRKTLIDSTELSEEIDDNDYTSDFSIEDTSDDDLLSASPQIPANLLKLVERRKQDKGRSPIHSDTDSSPGTSPYVQRGPWSISLSGRRSSQSQAEYRRPSIDLKGRPRTITRLHLLSAVLGSAVGAARRYSFENQGQRARSFRLPDRLLSPLDLNEIKRKYDYAYYNNYNKIPVRFLDVEVIRMKLPQEAKLPYWFIRGRDQWERLCEGKKSV